MKVEYFGGMDEHRLETVVYTNTMTPWSGDDGEPPEWNGGHILARNGMMLKPDRAKVWWTWWPTQEGEPPHELDCVGYWKA